MTTANSDFDNYAEGDHSTIDRPTDRLLTLTMNCMGILSHVLSMVKTDYNDDVGLFYGTGNCVCWFSRFRIWHGQDDDYRSNPLEKVRYFMRGPALEEFDRLVGPSLESPIINLDQLQENFMSIFSISSVHTTFCRNKISSRFENYMKLAQQYNELLLRFQDYKTDREMTVDIDQCTQLSTWNNHNYRHSVTMCIPHTNIEIKSGDLLLKSDLDSTRYEVIVSDEVIDKIGIRFSSMGSTSMKTKFGEISIFGNALVPIQVGIDPSPWSREKLSP